MAAYGESDQHLTGEIGICEFDVTVKLSVTLSRFPAME